jgi:hypothetical protein
MLFAIYYEPAPVLVGPPPQLHVLRDEAARERDAQRQARNAARRALSAVAGRRVAEVRGALAVRANALRRAA